MEPEKCCTVSCDLTLDQTYWDNQYQANDTGWDLGKISPPLQSHIDRIQSKNTKILIPGCGNGYEAEYLLEQGFTNVSVIDIAPTLVEKLREKFAAKPINIILGDFFAHDGRYDIVLEQTFFCALPLASATLIGPCLGALTLLVSGPVSHDHAKNCIRRSCRRAGHAHEVAPAEGDASACRQADDPPPAGDA